MKQKKNKKTKQQKKPHEIGFFFLLRFLFCVSFFFVFLFCVSWFLFLFLLLCLLFCYFLFYFLANAVLITAKYLIRTLSRPSPRAVTRNTTPVTPFSRPNSPTKGTGTGTLLPPASFPL